MRTSPDALRPEQRSLPTQPRGRKLGRSRWARARCARGVAARTATDTRPIRPDDPPCSHRRRLRPNVRRTGAASGGEPRRLARQRSCRHRRRQRTSTRRSRCRRRPRRHRQGFLRRARSTGDALGVAGAHRRARRSRWGHRIPRCSRGRFRLAHRSCGSARTGKHADDAPPARCWRGDVRPGPPALRARALSPPPDRSRNGRARGRRTARGDVVAPNATEAEVHATALAIASLEDARAQVDAQPSVSALYVPDEGPPVQLGSLPVVPQVQLEVAA